MRLVKRSERLQFAEPLDHVIVDPNRRREIGAAVHDTVADPLEFVMALLRKPGKKLPQKILVGKLGAAALVKAAAEDHLAARVAHGQMRSDPDLLDLAPENLPQFRSGRQVP